METLQFDLKISYRDSISSEKTFKEATTDNE
jgi:hypothetical protein